MKINKKNSLPLNILIFILFTNFFFGYSFQILNIISIPINYIFLVLLVFFLKFHLSSIYLFKLGIYNFILIFLIFNIIKLIISYPSYQIYALRDSTYAFDLLFIVISFTIFTNLQNNYKIINIINYFFYITLVFIFFWFFRDFLTKFSLTINSPTGAQADLFFNFSTLSLITAWYAFYKLIFDSNKVNINRYLFFILLISFSLIFLQRRSIYLCLILVFIISLFFNNKETFKVILILLIGSLLIPLLNFLGISLTGKIGDVDNIFFFFEHFLSALPGYNYENEIFETTSDTANLRLVFWKFVIKTQFSNINFLIFGQDYGAPLVFFKSVGGIPVREPHNMYLTVFARTGIFGLMIFLIIHFKLLSIWIQSYKLSLLQKKYIENKILIFLGIYFLFIYIIGLTDSILVANYYSIVFNIFWGWVISIHYKLKKNENSSNT